MNTPLSSTTHRPELLKKALFDGEYEEFDAIISNYRQAFPQDKDLSQLFLSLGSSALFGFSSLSTDQNELREQRLKRELKVLETFKNPFNQLQLLSFDIENITQEHLKCLSILPPSLPQDFKDKVKNRASDVLFILFDKHQFDCCVLLEKLYDLSWRDPVNEFYFSYKTKYSRGRFTVTPKNAPIPRFHLAGLCFSPQTKDHLISHGIKEEELSQCLGFIDDCCDILNNPKAFNQFHISPTENDLKACFLKLEQSKNLCLQSVLATQTQAFLPKSKPPSKKML